MASTFGKSFAHELGKDFGKVAMNAVFRDSWATPYRRVNPSLKEYRENKIRIEEERLRLQRRQAEDRAEIERRNQLYLLDSAVRDNIDKLVAIELPQNVDALNTILNKLSVQMKTEYFQKESGDDVDEGMSEGRIRNNYLYALVEKYEQALLELQSLSPKDVHIPRYAKILVDKKNEIKRHKNLKVLMIIAFILLAIALGAGCLLAEYNESIHPIDRGAVGEFLGTLFGESTPAEPMSIRFLYLGYALLGICGLSLVIIPLIMFFSRLKWKKKEMSLYSIDVVPTEPSRNSAESQGQNEVPKSECNDKDLDGSIFFDLNENNRIGKTLVKIWSRYQGKVSDEIISRRPIFSADGVSDCILYVGVNPSYDPEDDRKFIENNDKKTLLYGSFYGREDAPRYFKYLEMFAAELGKTYTHINLLYARENDRDKLLKSNPDFIREQLELTYDTIVKINPKAIIFFTSYCKTLIFGPGRWTDQSSYNALSGSYILNGTDIPIFFTEDVTTYDENQVDDLIERIKSLS